MKYAYKTEGNIIYPDEQMLTWGPFYFYSLDKAKERMKKVLKDIVEWVNGGTDLIIKPENLIYAGDKQIVFNIKAWKDDEHLEKCNGIITVETIFFED